MYLRVTRSKCLALVTAISTFSLLFNVNFSLFGMPEFITSVRLAIAFLIVGVCLFVASNNISVPLGEALSNRVVLIGLVSVIFVFISLSVSYLLNQSNANVNYIVSACLQVVAYLMYMCVVLRADKCFLMKLLLFMSSIYLGFWIAFVYFTFGSDFSNWFAMRAHLNEVLPQGLNRFLNGVILLQAIALMAVLRVISVPSLYIAFASVILMFCIILCFISGSRQYIASSVMIAVGVISISRNYLHFFTLGLFVALVVFLGLTIISSDGMRMLLEQVTARVLESTTSQLEYGSDRFDRYNKIISLIADNVLYGIGPGAFFEKTGLYPDSGYLQFLVEEGVVAFFIHVSLIFSVCIGFFLSRGKYGRVSQVFMLFFIVNILFANSFNELFLEYYTWVVLLLVFAFKDYMLLRPDGAMVKSVTICSS